MRRILYAEHTLIRQGKKVVDSPWTNESTELEEIVQVLGRLTLFAAIGKEA